MHPAPILRRRIKLLSWLFIIGLTLSGLTAVPLQAELNWVVNCLGLKGESSGLAHWLLQIKAALDDTEARYPFLYYGTDWLAFGHFVIALAFIGVLRDPVRNRWLFDFSLIACALVIPFALIFGGLRGIPLWWRFIDCSFGVFGALPLWVCRRWAIELEKTVSSGTSQGYVS